MASEAPPGDLISTVLAGRNRATSWPGWVCTRSPFRLDTQPPLVRRTSVPDGCVACQGPCSQSALSISGWVASPAAGDAYGPVGRGGRGLDLEVLACRSCRRVEFRVLAR